MLFAASSEPKISTSIVGDTEVSVDDEKTAENALKTLVQSEKPRRVKVYLLEGDDWLDNGTGYCMGEVDMETQKAYFVVRNELDASDIILRLCLEGGIQYQRQQETLIVWTDLCGKDLALSFQENDGCADLCEFIVKVQQENISPLISLYYVLPAMSAGGDGPKEITELIAGPINYPPEYPSAGSLPAMLEVITQCCNSMYSRYKMLSFLVETHYFDKLFVLFHRLEAARDLTALHRLNDVVKVALYYNEPKIIEELVSLEQRMTGLAGVLEYDGTFPNFKACHREYLMDEARLKLVVEVPLPERQNEGSMDIFRKDFVLQYLKNVALPRSLEDLALHVLAGMIHANQMEIISFLNDPRANHNFLARLFDLYSVTLKAPVTQKHDGVRLIHQYVFVAKNNLSNQASDFFSALVRHGLLRLVKYALAAEDSTVRVLGIEILTAVIDQDVSLVNLPSNENKAVDELADDDENSHLHNTDPRPAHDEKHCHETSEAIKLNLMNDMALPLVLAKLLLTDTNAALKIQTYEAMKSLLCSTVFDVEYSGKEDLGDFSPDGTHEAYVKKYFESFYEHVAPLLFQTFTDLASDTNADISLAAEKKLQQDPVLFQHLCDLISFCCHEHESSICRAFFIKSRALDGIVRVLALNVHVTLKLGVLRCLKSLLLLDDHAFCRYVIERDLFKPFFTFFHTVTGENSLPNSLCLDLLEIIVKRSSLENFGCLAIHISQNYRAFLETKINYVSTGRDLLASAKKFKDRVKDSTVTSVDVDPDYYRDIQPSSPIAREENGYHRSAIELPLPHSGNPNTFSEDRDDGFVKRKREDVSESVSEKRNCLADREQISTNFQENTMEEDTSPRSMTIQP